MSEEVEWKLRELSQILGTQWQDLGGYGGQAVWMRSSRALIESDPFLGAH